MRIAIDPSKCSLPEQYAKICYAFLTIKYIHNKEIEIVNGSLAFEIGENTVYINKKEKLFSIKYTDKKIPTYEEFEREFLKSRTCLCSGTFDRCGECSIGFIVRNNYPDEYPYPIMIEDISEKFTDVTVKLVKDLESIIE